MSVDVALTSLHRNRAREAREVYIAGMLPTAVEARRAQAIADIVETLRATKLLRDIAAAVANSAKHVSVLRRLLAPSMSQDQFEILCPEYSKAKENAGSKMLPASADAIAAKILEWRDRRLTRWLSGDQKPTRREIQILLEAVALRIVDQSLATDKRNRASAQQEQAVVDLLKKNGWTQKSAPLITQPSQLLSREFMHKTKFAAGTSSQEVDIACGLDGAVILAMECKATNDVTNSVKRVNDVLKKAGAWQDHWGSFVRTAALLQGVIKYDDVHRLLEKNVLVFWSHRLDEFEAWLDANASR